MEEIYCQNMGQIQPFNSKFKFLYQLTCFGTGYKDRPYRVVKIWNSVLYSPVSNRRGRQKKQRGWQI